jgi:hypothetical protein
MDTGPAGFVLLETALAIPLLAAVAVALAWGVSLGGTSMALGDAARQAARDVARGVDVSTAIASARGSAPGADLHVEAANGSVVVIAEQEVVAPVPILRGLSFRLSQHVVVPGEWS